MKIDREERRIGKNLESYVGLKDLGSNFKHCEGRRGRLREWR